MGARYLTALADWCRAAGLHTIEDAGWQYRARSSGGYEPDRPWAVMWHHTASKTTPANDANYICRGGDYPPIANLMLDRSGAVWVCAGGATNTNGKGGPLTVSRGVVPVDRMNEYAVAIEACNDGVGEPWPVAQIDAYFVLSNVLTERLELFSDDIAHHHSWAPGRKIDCAVASAVQGAWRPRSINSAGSWSLPDTQTEAAERAGTLPTPDPGPEPEPEPTGDDEMRIVTALDRNGTIWVGNGVARRALDSMDVFSNYVVLAASGALVFVNTSGQQVRELGHVRTVEDVTIEALGERVDM